MGNDLDFMLDNWVWSYSCLESFRNCHYYWYLNYILLKRSDESGCFADFGSLGHSLLESYLNGDLFSFELADKFTEQYPKVVSDTFPPVRGERLYDKYYDQGLVYFNNTDKIEDIQNKYDILGVEDKCYFKIDDRKFTARLDLEVKNKDGEYEIIDHKSKKKLDKSRLMKKYSKEDWIQTTDGRYVPFKSFIQLYLYSIPFKEKYGTYPKYLNLNMFRIDDWYKIEFNVEQFERSKQWALDTINDIYNEVEWHPMKSKDYRFCLYLCSNSTLCKYCSKYVGEE